MISEQHGHTYFKKLADSFNESIKMGKFPDILKKAEVTPDYKKDDLNDKQNYSPVTTLSSLKNLSGPMTPGEPCPTHSPSLHTHTQTHTHTHTHTHRQTDRHTHTHTEAWDSNDVYESECEGKIMKQLVRVINRKISFGKR